MEARKIFENVNVRSIFSLPMMKFFFIVFSFFSFLNGIYCQVLTEAFNGKQYRVFTSLSEAHKVNPDSVEGLVLCSNNFKDFPVEVLKFKNLKYLNICSYSWHNVLDSLTSEQRHIYDSVERRRPNDCMFRFKPNIIRHIPKEIKKLKKLEMVDFSSADISRNAGMQLIKYLPNATTLPSKKDYRWE